MSVTIESAATVGIPSSIGSSARPRSGIVIHYVGGSAVARGSHANCRAQVRSWHSYHRTGQGWAGIGYHYCICHHGIVMTGRGLHRSGAHAPGANSSHIGILFMLGGSQNPTVDQLAGFRAFRTWLGQQGVSQGNVTPHSRWISTSCPGNHLRSRVANNNWGSGGSPGGPGGGGGGTRSMSAIQRAVNAMGYTPALDVDGLDGPKTQAGVRWLQNKIGVSADGIWGPATEAAYTAYMEDEVPIHSRYEKRRDQVLDRGEWVSLEFTERHDGSTGGIYSVVGVQGDEKPAGFYDISVGVTLEGVTPGAEVQIRATEYESDGSGGWQIARNRPLHSPVHVGGKSHFVYAWKSHKAKDRRVRFRIAQFGDGPATITRATSEVFFFPKK